MFWIIAITAFGLALGQEEDTAALIVGGFVYNANTYYKSVELFGCPNRESFFVDDYPLTVSSAGGVYLPDEQQVLVCGGVACEQQLIFYDCDNTNECYAYDGLDNWENAPPLLRADSSIILALGPDLRRPNDNTLKPITLGHSQRTEMLNFGSWKSYFRLNTPRAEDWSTNSCLIQDGNIVYEMFGANINALDVTIWSEQVLDPGMPSVGGKCAMTSIDGDKGNALFKNIIYLPILDM